MDLEPERDNSPQRTMLALLAIMAMVFLWATFYGRRPEPPPAAEEETPKPATSHGATTAAPAEKAQPPEIKPAPSPKPSTSAPAKEAKQPPVQPPKPKPELPARTIEKRSKILSAVFTNQDGALASLTLLDYFRTPLTKRAARKALHVDPHVDLTPFGFPILGQAGTEPSYVLLPRPDVAGRKADPAAEAVPDLFKPCRYEIDEKASADPDRVVFRAVFAEGRLEVIKTFLLPSPDEPLQRHVLLELQFRNLGTQPLTLPGYRLRGPGGIAVDHSPPSWDKPNPTEAERKTAEGLMSAVVASVNDRGQITAPRVACSTLQKEEYARSEGRVMWSAIQSNYFCSILEPILEKDQKNFVWGGGAMGAGELNLSANIETTSFTLAPGQAVVHHYRLYAGPKDREFLTPYASTYDSILESRWLDPLSDAMVWILRAAYRVIPNYGVAILILTVLVRVLMHPLSKKSQTSMGRMQKLQPQVKEIQEKFKGDRKRQQEEMMKLYKEYGVNPMGGCLPIVLQLPVFIGLWRALSESIDLRQASFVFWMRDLSQPDYFMGVVNVLPIVSCVIMFLQQRSMPKSGDPQQQQTQKIMGYMMPVLLLWLFYSLASGLSLYFIASSLIGIAEQKVIKRHLDKLGDLKPIAKKPVDKKTGRERKRLLSYTQKRKPF
jgi:YidC/Oxa1 family membrane protein insertase